MKDPMKDPIVELLKRLVETPSINPLFEGSDPTSVNEQVGEARIAEVVESFLRYSGLETFVVESESPNRPSVVGVWRGAAEGRSLMLNGHLDTVGIEGYERPFVATVEGDRLYGRGSYDMKGGLAACMAAIAALAREGERLAGDLWISAVADEEAASEGARAVAERFPTDGVVVAEPTELQPIVAHKGFVWLEITTSGFACHGSQHERGVDANRRMAHVLRAIDRLEKERSKLSHPLLGSPSLHVGKIAGGLGPSLYSPACEATLELRTLPGETPEGLQQRLKEIVEEEWPEQPDEPPRIEIVLNRPHLETDPTGPLAQALQDGLDQTGGKKTEPGGVAYWTDAGIFANPSTEVVLFGPSGAGAHENEEWVEISSVVAVAEALTELARGYCQ